jgi:hypothetical protein
MLPQKLGFAGSESFSTVHDSVARRALGAGPLARVASRVRSGSLDRALIAGADPAASPQLVARAARLTSPRFRALIADGLERLLQAAQGPPSRWRALSRRDSVLANASELRDLAALLRGDSPLYARGIAILSGLLSDGTGPAYLGHGEALARELHEARAAMHGGHAAAPLAGDVPVAKLRELERSVGCARDQQ